MRSLFLEAVALLLAAGLFALACALPNVVMAGREPFDVRWTTAWGDQRVTTMEPPPAWMLPLDDAYIFIRYAQQAARGKPMQWNDGEPSTGASSFLYPWLLLPGQWLAGDLAGWSQWSRIVGALSLWLLGLASALLLRRVGLGGGWPLAGAVAVMWSGPVGVTSVGGMESALNAAGIVAACALWVPAPHPSPPAAQQRWQRWAALGLVALLPLLRPEDGVLTGLAALALLTGWGPESQRPAWRRWPSLLLLLPGLALGFLNLALTGSFRPAAAVLKSWTSGPFTSTVEPIAIYLRIAASQLVPLYLGLKPSLLWPPVGLVGIAVAGVVVVRSLRRSRSGSPRATAARTPSPRRLLPLTVVWLALVALAPLSASLYWQAYRHHQAGMVCAWLLAVVGLAWVGRRLAAGKSAAAAALGSRGLPLLLVGLVLLGVPHWSTVSLNWSAALAYRHGPALGWLATEARDGVLLVNDAGLPALVHDGPAIDLMGLGTPGMSAAYRHGGGAVAEALARRPRPPAVAAVNLDVMVATQLLTRPLVRLDDPDNQTVVAPVRPALLAATVLAGPGVDFGDLASEERAGVRLRPRPLPGRVTVPLVLVGPHGHPSLQGCRPLLGRLEMALPPGLAGVTVWAAPAPEAATALRVDVPGAAPPLLTAPLPATGRWEAIPVALPPGSRRLRLERPEGSGVACLEAVAFEAGAADGG